MEPLNGGSLSERASSAGRDLVRVCGISHGGRKEREEGRGGKSKHKGRSRQKQKGLQSDSTTGYKTNRNHFMRRHIAQCIEQTSIHML